MNGCYLEVYEPFSFDPDLLVKVIFDWIRKKVEWLLYAKIRRLDKLNRCHSDLMAPYIKRVNSQIPIGAMKPHRI